MKKTLIVDSRYKDMRIDRWIRNNLGKVPQSLIEKSLLNGKIKLNFNKVKSSHKLKINDQINILDFKFKEKIQTKKIRFKPCKEIIK